MLELLGVGLLGQQRVAGLGVDDLHARAVDLVAVFVRVGRTLRRVLVVAGRIELVHGLTHVRVDEYTAADGRRGRGLQRRCGIPSVLQLVEFVLVERPVAVDLPVDVLRADGNHAERDLDTLVGNQAGVHLAGRTAGFGARFGADDLVAGAGLVERHVDIEPVAQELGFQADFPAAGLFREDVRVVAGRRQRDAARIVRGRVVVVEREDRSVVTHLCPRTAQLDHVDMRGVDLERLVEQDTGRYRRVEIAPVGGSQRRRPVVAGRDVEEVGVVPRQVDKAVKAVGLPVAAVGRRVEGYRGVGERIHAGAFAAQLRGGDGGRVVFVAQDAAAECRRDAEAIPQLVVLEQEVRVVVVAADGLLAVHAVAVVERHEGFLLRAPFDIGVEAAAQREGQLGQDREVDAHVAEETVTIQFVQLLVQRAVGVVALEAVVDKPRSGVVFVFAAACQVVGIGITALHVLVAVSRDGVGVVAPDQAVHGRTLAVTRHGHVVAVLADVVDFCRQFDGLADLLVQGQCEGLLFVARVGRDPVVAQVGE